jgi:hypothetical protein
MDGLIEVSNLGHVEEHVPKLSNSSEVRVAIARYTRSRFHRGPSRLGSDAA